MSSLIKTVKNILKQDPLLQRVLKNTAYLFSSSSISMLLVALQSIFAARLLGIEALGLLTIAMSFVTNINQLFSFRMGEFVIRYFGKAITEKNLPHASAAVKASMVVEGLTSLLAFGFLFLAAPLGAKYIAKDLSSLYLFQIFSIAILANFMTESSTGVLRVLNHYKAQALITLIQSILTFSVITLAFLFKGTILTILWAYLIGKIFVGFSPTVIAFRSLRKEIGPDWWRTRIDILPCLREMATFAISTNLSGTIKLVVSESEPLWVGFFLNKQSVGLFKVAWAIVNLLIVPITPMIGTTFPEITRSIVAKKWKQLRQLLRRVTLISASWTILFIIGIVVFGKWIIGFAYGGAEFVPAYYPLLILCAGFGLTNIFFWNRTLLLSFGKANIPLYVLAAAAAAKVGLSFWLVPKYGLNAEMALLSGNFIITIAVLVAIGLRMIQRSEKAFPEEVK